MKNTSPEVSTVWVFVCLFQILKKGRKKRFLSLSFFVFKREIKFKRERERRQRLYEEESVDGVHVIMQQEVMSWPRREEEEEAASCWLMVIPCRSFASGAGLLYGKK